MMKSSNICQYEEDDKQFDPFRFRDETPYERILQFLSGKDIISLSIVSKFWYYFIAESDVAMNKIKFVVSESRGKRLSLDIIENSKRNYKHLEIKGIFNSTNNIISFIMKHAISLLSIMTCYDLKLEGECQQLPNLEKLIIYGINIEKPINLEFQGFCTSSNNLLELCIYGKVKMTAVVQKCLERNNQLKKLVLEQGSIDESYFKAAHLYEFKLEVLRCDISSYDNEVYWTNLNSFIDYQADSLREIKINCDFRRLHKILSLLPKLRIITFYPIDMMLNTKNFEALGDLNFLGHLNIEEARFILIPEEIISHFARRSPKLHTVYVANLSFEIFTSIVKYVPNLRCLKYAYIDEDDITSNIHDQLIEFHQNFHCNNCSKLEIIQI